MAHKNVDYKPEDIQFPNQKIVQSELVHEMQSSYIEYAMSVIVGRALPDVRDGFPDFRRIKESAPSESICRRSALLRIEVGGFIRKPVCYRELPWCRIMRSPEPFVRVPAMCCRRLCSSESKSNSV